MNDKYISVSKFKQMLANLDVKGFTPAVKKGIEIALSDAVPQLLDDEPAADVQPVKRGKWIKKDGDPWRTEYKCSECGADLNAGCAWNNHPEQCDKYCYNCGARMDGDSE